MVRRRHRSLLPVGAWIQGALPEGGGLHRRGFLSQLDTKQDLRRFLRRGAVVAPPAAVNGAAVAAALPGSTTRTSAPPPAAADAAAPEAPPTPTAPRRRLVHPDLSDTRIQGARILGSRILRYQAQGRPRRCGRPAIGAGIGQRMRMHMHVPSLTPASPGGRPAHTTIRREHKMRDLLTPPPGESKMRDHKIIQHMPAFVG